MKRGSPPPTELTPERSALVDSHIGLVHHVTRRIARYVSSEVDYDELVSAGALGLLAAARTFDPGRGLKFSTFAVPRIRGAILDDLRRQDPAPRSVRRHARQLATARSRLGNELGRPPRRSEVAAAIGISQNVVDRWELSIASVERLSVEDMTELEYRSSDRRHNPAIASDDYLPNQIDRLEDGDRVRRAMLMLTDQQRDVLVRYYWFEETLAEIAAEMGLSESRISQVKAAALKRLRTQLSAAA